MIKAYLPWILTILYIVFPFDLIPDFMLGPGCLDDLAVLGFFLWWVYNKKKGEGNKRTSSAKTKNDKEQTASFSEEDPFAILGVERGASEREIKAAYKNLAAKYHPDKVQHLGNEFQALAHEKFVSIQNAYSKLMKQTGSG